MYPVSAQFSINDLSMAPAAASGDDEPDDMALKRRGKVGSDGLQICTMPTRANREKSAAVSGEEDAEKAENPQATQGATVAGDLSTDGWACLA